MKSKKWNGDIINLSKNADVLLQERRDKPIYVDTHPATAAVINELLEEESVETLVYEGWLPSDYYIEEK